MCIRDSFFCRTASRRAAASRSPRRLRALPPPTRRAEANYRHEARAPLGGAPLTTIISFCKIWLRAWRPPCKKLNLK
eukprot:7275138-Alexandrium_andersonii.AAC.1